MVATEGGGGVSGGNGGRDATEAVVGPAFSPQLREQLLQLQRELDKEQSTVGDLRRRVAAIEKVCNAIGCWSVRRGSLRVIFLLFIFLSRCVFSSL